VQTRRYKKVARAFGGRGSVIARLEFLISGPTCVCGFDEHKRQPAAPCCFASFHATADEVAMRGRVPRGNSDRQTPAKAALDGPSTFDSRNEHFDSPVGILAFTRSAPAPYFAINADPIRTAPFPHIRKTGDLGVRTVLGEYTPLRFGKKHNRFDQTRAHGPSGSIHAPRRVEAQTWRTRCMWRWAHRTGATVVANVFLLRSAHVGCDMRA